MLQLTDIQNNVELKLLAGGRMVPVKIVKEGKRLEFHFGFNKPLMEEIKSMEGHKYHGFDEINPRKLWTVADTPRNRFQISFLAHPGKDDPNNPYYLYDRPLCSFTPNRPLYEHQCDLARHGLTRHYCIFAAEMGTGKTLAAIEVMEASGCHDWIWVGPKSALVSVKLEFEKWKAKILPLFVTYEGLKKLMTEWEDGRKAPMGVVFDESSRIKNPTAQRTLAARHLADSIRQEWGTKGFVIEMSGSPSPKAPYDWWSQCEVACPGFLKEGDITKFKKRIAITELKETFEGGGAYNSLVTYRDDEKKCDICGLFEDAETHHSGIDVMAVTPSQSFHKFKPSVNEIAGLYRRMNGLVMVKFKKDCLDLPDKVYREILLPPSRSILNSAGAIQAKCSSTIQAITLLRELSDGFQYQDTVVGSQECHVCKGSKTVTEPFDENDPENDPTPEEWNCGHRLVSDDDFSTWSSGPEIKVGQRTVACRSCSGTGSVVKYDRQTVQVPTPKEDALKNILDEHDDVGRLVVYGGFTGTIDRIMLIAKAAGWNIIRVDGRGWFSDLPLKNSQDMVREFQAGKGKYSRILFIGQPGAAGMGLTLTASPSICYYSNDFNAESRIQSEDRIHRPGMDVNRGATIIDLIHLPTDRLILNNLKKKRQLQAMTMGEVRANIDAAMAEAERML